MKTSKFIYQYGLLTGILSTVYAIMRFILDTHYVNDTVSTIVTTIILIGGIVLGQLAFRKENNGLVSFKQCLKIGVGIGLISALLGLAYYFVLNNFIDPEFVSNATKIDFDTRMAADPEFLSKLCEINQICTYDEYLNQSLTYAWVAYPAIIIVSLFFSLIFSLCTGIIIKKSE